MRPLTFLSFMMVVLYFLSAQHHELAPVEHTSFLSLTSYDTLQAFLRRIERAPCISHDHIALTRQGRFVSLVKVTTSDTFGQDTSKIRVLLFAQQHGDEPSGKEAMTMLLAKCASGDLQHILNHIDLLIVPQMNPDGSELNQRQTTDSVDLNRNHVLLTSPETRALHDVFDSWHPQVSVDIHQFSSFSKSWSDSGFIKTGDVQLGLLTNLNTGPEVYRLQHDEIFPFIARTMEYQGYSFHEYIVGSPSTRVRYSTTEINDGRQSFGILGTLSFIQEGRRWRTLEDHLERQAKSQLACIEALLQFCADHAEEVHTIVSRERYRIFHMAGQPVVTGMDHYSNGDSLRIPVKWLATDRDTLWNVTPYHNVVKAIADVIVPRNYVVPQVYSRVIDLLKRHHIRFETLEADTTFQSTSYLIDSTAMEEIEEDMIPRVYVHATPAAIRFHQGDVIVPTAQLHALFLATVLEPQSMWGLTKYQEFSDFLHKKTWPILKVP